MLDPEWPSFHDLIIAYKSCRLHKPASVSQIRFEMRLGENINDLLTEIHSNRYKPMPAKCFVVMHPKPREIFAADFRDRVVHHLVVSQLEPRWNRRFIHSNFACRVGRGTHGAIRYAQEKVKSLSRGGLDPVWCLQLDIAKFFVSIDRTILCNLLTKSIHHPKLKALIHAIYGHDARIGVKKSSDPSMFTLIPEGKSWFDQKPDKGLPIGNLTSQFGANAYMTELDHLIQRKLKPEAYLRYMDDLTLLDRDPRTLKTMAEPIDQWLQENRRQQLNPAKTKLDCLTAGISYLGYELRQVNSPLQPLQVFSKPMKKWKFIQALKKLECMPNTTPVRPHPLAPLLVDKKTIQEISCINSHMSSLIHANTFIFRKKALKKFHKNTQDQQDVPLELAPDPWSPFLIKKDYRAIKLR